ncbi:MAG: hypothetical protein AB1384_14285 [Actinomycetota bacterium]
MATYVLVHGGKENGIVWEYCGIASDHKVMVSHPAELAEILLHMQGREG